MNWIPLTTEEDLETIRKKSAETPQVIFKHSTRCSISSMIKNRLERDKEPTGVDFNFLDLIAYRPLSAKISEAFMIQHQSPQILLIKNGECIFDESHNGISMDDIAEQSVK